MILPALIDYYDRLAADDGAEVARPGFSRQKIAFEVVIDPKDFSGIIEDGRSEDRGKMRPTPRLVLGGAKPSGSGINPCFLWDNPAYMLGYKPDDPDPQRTAMSFAAFRDFHLAHEKAIGDEAFSTVCRFLERWDPAHAGQHPLLAELGTGFGVFRIRGGTGYVHEIKTIQRYYQRHVREIDEGTEGVSLITGTRVPIARLHEPKIKGVAGSQSAGAVIVGFNLDAFTSYAKLQSYNAPVGVDDAFRYTVALNHLLADSRHRVRLGDATVVFWSDRPEPFVDEYFGAMMSESADDPATTDRLRAFIDKLRQGGPDAALPDTSTRFYVLGLSPNQARLSVRFWFAGTVGEQAEHLQRHIDQLEMVGARPNDMPALLRGLIYETMPAGKTANRDAQVAQVAQLAGELTRAVLTGGPYPQAVFTGIIRRIRAERTVNHRRAAMLKAFLIRNRNQEVPVALNIDHPEPAYHMGRLFAAIEKTQQDAMPGLNKTIKDGYFGTASASPATVFPRLIRMHQHHIEKLDGGLKVNRERLIQEILSHIDQRFPAHLSLDNQGIFHIGYYHQRQDFFTKKPDTEPASEEALA